MLFKGVRTILSITLIPDCHNIEPTMSQEQLKKSFEKITESMKIVAQDFEYVAKLFEGMYQRF